MKTVNPADKGFRLRPDPLVDDGVTTFFLYWIAYCCLNKFQPNDRVCIIVGPNINSAEDLLTRFKNLFSKIAPGLFDKSKSTVAIVNEVRVEVFPSHHVSAMRGLDKVRLILSDESDYYPPFQQKEVRAVVEGYIGKPNSDPHIIFVSTPAAPGGLMQTIESEQNSLYCKHFFDYKYGLEGPQPIYSQQQIEKAKHSPDFGREFELQYLGLVGNCFSQQSIESATKLAYDPGVIWPDVKKSVGVDVGWGSSMFAIVVTQFVNNRIEVIVADQFERPFFQAMIDEIWRLKQRCHYLSNIYVDSSAPEFIYGLKREFSESTDRHYIHERLRYHEQNNTRVENEMFVIPVSFGKFGPEMIQHASWIMDERDEQGNSVIAIDKDRFPKLITVLRTAVADNYRLDKSESSYSDLTDAFRLSLRFYGRRKT